MWCGKYRSRKSEIKFQSTVGLSLIWLVLIKYPPGVSCVKYLFNNPSAYGLSWCLSGKEPTCSAGAAGDMVWSLDQEDPLEEVMATHSSILLRKIPWTEESVGLQFIGLQKRTRLKNLTEFILWGTMIFTFLCLVLCPNTLCLLKWCLKI